MSDLDRPLQLSLMFTSKASSIPKGEEAKRGLHLGRLLALPVNIRLGWKDLPGTKTLGYKEY